MTEQGYFCTTQGGRVRCLEGSNVLLCAAGAGSEAGGPRHWQAVRQRADCMTAPFTLEHSWYCLRCQAQSQSVVNSMPVSTDNIHSKAVPGLEIAAFLSLDLEYAGTE